MSCAAGVGPRRHDGGRWGVGRLCDARVPGLLGGQCGAERLSAGAPLSPVATRTRCHMNMSCATGWPQIQVRSMYDCAAGVQHGALPGAVHIAAHGEGRQAGAAGRPHHCRRHEGAADFEHCDAHSRPALAASESYLTGRSQSLCLACRSSCWIVRAAARRRTLVGGRTGSGRVAWTTAGISAWLSRLFRAPVDDTLAGQFDRVVCRRLDFDWAYTVIG